MLKTQDIVNLSEQDKEALLKVILVLKGLTEQYQKTNDLAELEALKREFIGYLQQMAELFSKVKRYKGTNHIYLEYAMKKLKAETLEQIMITGTSVTNAEREYPKHPYYVERMALIEKIQSFCIKVEELYHAFSTTMQSMIQSISVSNKELHNTKQQ